MFDAQTNVPTRPTRIDYSRKYSLLPFNGSFKKQSGLRRKARVGYISARIIQLGYIQLDVTMLQEYDTQRGERT